MPEPITPRYGEAALADLVPSLLAALEVPEFNDVVGIPPVRRVVLLVADGLGFELLRRYADLAPFLTEYLDSAHPLTTGFPSTTAVSLSSIGSGVPPGVHGVLGYTMALPPLPRPMNMLQWALHGKPVLDLLDTVVPESFYAPPTAFELAQAAGVSVDRVGPPDLAATGLSRSTLRGGRYRGATGPRELVREVIAALREGGSRGGLIYAYHAALDSTGHAHGVDSREWRDALERLDLIAQHLAEALPPDGLLVVTGDHGMVDVPFRNHRDVADQPLLRAGVRYLGGEPRARHVYAEPGAAGDVLAAWREVLGRDWWVVPGEEAIAAGWFGPQVTDRVRPRVGDVIAAAQGPSAVMQREVFRLETEMVGHHGSLTADEVLVPRLFIHG